MEARAWQTDEGERRAEEARAWLHLAYEENGWTGLAARVADVERAWRSRGTYDLLPHELAYGCRVAWRNATRCVGRAYWRYLDVRDVRHVTDPDEVFAHLVEHLRGAWNGGNLKPTVSVFGPGVRIVNDQLIRYAGYRADDGRVLGDAKNIGLTEYLTRLGWRPETRSRFDVLPIAIRSGQRTRLYTLPKDAVREVDLVHPDVPDFASLGLKWHALPVISDLRLDIGGSSFACAPFNGWYLGTEIAARNLADEDRYDALPSVARVLGLDTARSRTLWRDRALVELNVAVLHSFDAAGVKISDHHAVTKHFVAFEARERAAGRAVYGRWSWLVPPLSPAATPVYHRTYEDREVTPNFFPQAKLWDEEAPNRCPFH